MLRNTIEIIEHNCKDLFSLNYEDKLREELYEVINRRNSTGERVVSIAPITSTNDEVSYTSGFIVVFEYETED
jgi:hypothetical protein